MKLSDLQTKNIVNIEDGKNIGTIIDANIREDGYIETLLLEVNKNFFSFNKETDVEVKWENITKIGEDVILVNTSLNEKI